MIGEVINTTVMCFLYKRLLLNRKSKSCTFSHCICFFSPNHFLSPPLSLHRLSFISHTEFIMFSTLLFMLTLAFYLMTSCHLFILPLCSPPPHPHLSVKLPFPSSLLDAAPPLQLSFPRVTHMVFKWNGAH